LEPVAIGTALSCAWEQTALNGGWALPLDTGKGTQFVIRSDDLPAAASGFFSGCVSREGSSPAKPGPAVRPLVLAGSGEGLLPLLRCWMQPP